MIVVMVNSHGCDGGCDDGDIGDIGDGDLDDLSSSGGGPEQEVSRFAVVSMWEQQARHDREMNMRGLRAETEGCIHAVWGAFTSLLAATATRHSLLKQVASTVISYSAATLKAYNRYRRERIMLSCSPSTSEGSSLGPTEVFRMLCLDGGGDVLDALGCRLMHLARARAASLSSVREAVLKLLLGNPMTLDMATTSKEKVGYSAFSLVLPEVEEIVLEAAQVRRVW